MTYDDIQSEYEKLGFQRGWTFMMTKKDRLLDASVCLVGLNPGGTHDGEAIWSCEEGNAYHTEKWGKGGKNYSALQRQVHELEKVLDLNPNVYFAAQFVPFRSPDWRGLAEAAEATAFSQKLWSWVLSQSPATRFICLGKVAALRIAGLIDGAVKETHYKTGWGSVTIGQFVGDDGRVVIRLPHLSRYGLFGRTSGQSAIANESLKKAFGQPA